jgi:hypothetical protein
MRNDLACIVLCAVVAVFPFACANNTSTTTFVPGGGSGANSVGGGGSTSGSPGGSGTISNSGATGAGASGSNSGASTGAGASGSIGSSGTLGATGATGATSTTGAAAGASGVATSTGASGSSGAATGGTTDASTSGALDLDAASGWPTEAQTPVDGGATGFIAPGLGQDTASPPKPAVGPYGGQSRRDIQFSASSVDPMATLGQAGAAQHGRVDTSLTLKWKLIVLLPGIGGGPGLGTSGWIASQGFHEFDVAYDDAIPGAPNPPDPRASDPATVGNTRMNQFDAKGRTPSCNNDACSPTAPPIARGDCIEERVIKAVQHLAQVDPMGGWGFYLNADGTMRWSDAGFFGYSYGATHAAVISVYVRLGLVVVGSGPWFEFHPEASWLRTPSATPGSRAYAIYGKLDGRWPDYINNAKLLGWGNDFEVTATTQGPLPATAPTPWYNGSHSLLVDDQGHTEFCASSNTYCLYAFDGLGH